MSRQISPRFSLMQLWESFGICFFNKTSQPNIFFTAFVLFFRYFTSIKLVNMVFKISSLLTPGLRSFKKCYFSFPTFVQTNSIFDENMKRILTGSGLIKVKILVNMNLLFGIPRFSQKNFYGTPKFIFQTFLRSVFHVKSFSFA